MPLCVDQVENELRLPHRGISPGHGHSPANGRLLGVRGSRCDQDRKGQQQAPPDAFHQSFLQMNEKVPYPNEHDNLLYPDPVVSVYLVRIQPISSPDAES